MNKKMKVTKGNGKVLVAPAGPGAALNQKFMVKKHVTETASTLTEFLNEAQAELESLFA
jgi:hypothetical protein